MKILSRLTFLCTSIVCAFLLSGCKDKPAPVKQAPEVAYVVIEPEEVAVINELSGRLESYRNSDVRARVAGVLEKRLFEEGADINKGDKLFIIDPRSYEASVQNARAALARAEANFMQADLKYKRYIPLVKISAVSKQEYDDALAAQRQAAADVASAKAALVNAKLDLEYSTVLAPISGRIGRSMVTEGALVGQGEVTLLAVIQQIDPIYLNLTQSSAELLQLQQAVRKGVLKNASEEGLKVTLIMEDGTPYTHQGKLIFSDITVDPSTGEISIRALFPNPDKILLPGMYVRGRMEQAINENAITVPKQAVQRSAEGSTVYVINKDDIAEVRNVKTGASYHEKWVVLNGLKAGDKVVVEGIQKVKPGYPVTPVLWQKNTQQENIEKSAPDAKTADNTSTPDTLTPENTEKTETSLSSEKEKPVPIQEEPELKANIKAKVEADKKAVLENKTETALEKQKTEAAPIEKTTAQPQAEKKHKLQQNTPAPAAATTPVTPAAEPKTSTQATKEKNQNPIKTEITSSAKTAKPTQNLRTMPAEQNMLPDKNVSDKAVISPDKTIKE